MPNGGTGDDNKVRTPHIPVYACLLACAFQGATANPSSAQGTVEVSPRYSALHFDDEAAVLEDNPIIVQIPIEPYDDRYSVTFVVKSGKLRVRLLDGRDIVAKNPRPVFLIDRTVSGSASFVLPKVPSSRGAALIVSNETRKPIRAKIRVIRKGTRPVEVTDAIKKLVEIPIRAIEVSYVLPEFKLIVTPVGTKNAFAGKNIVIATELLADLHEKGLGKAIVPIVLHELAHLLLDAWDLPGHDNEDIADEFSTIWLAKLSPDYLDAFIDWLEAKDPVEEAIVQLAFGGRHSLSIQRARNLKAAIRNADDLERRWGKLLAPFARSSDKG